MASKHSSDSPQGDAVTTQQYGQASTSNLVLYVVVAFVVVGTTLRFWPRSDMWLDEALSFNISQTGWSGIPDALRHDGHPPLYYYVLWLWTKIGGDTTWWIRSLSGVLYSAALPLMYLAGRRATERTHSRSDSTVALDPHRGGLIALAIASTAAFGVRFGSETRMYAFVVTLTMIAYLIFSHILWDRDQRPHLERSSWKWIVGGGFAVTALLWTHYWSLWLCVATGLLLMYQWVRRPESRGNATAGILALVLGGILFLPWVPTLLYQSAHTGTPWGEPVGVVETMTTLISSFSGDQLTSYILVSLVLMALFVAVTHRSEGSQQQLDRPVLVLTERFQPRVLGEACLLVLTIMIGWGTNVITASTFQPRYGAVVFVLFVLMVAAGLNLLWNPRVVAGILVVVLVLTSYVSVTEIRLDRTQAGDIANSIAGEFQPGDAVIACPDQIGVATQRSLEQRRVVDTTLVPYPTAGDPHFVDWVDYKERNEAATPQAFWDSLPEHVHNAERIFFVRAGGYETFDNDCALLSEVIGSGRERRLLVERGDAYESMDLWMYHRVD